MILVQHIIILLSLLFFSLFYLFLFILSYYSSFFSSMIDDAEKLYLPELILRSKVAKQLFITTIVSIDHVAFSSFNSTNRD